MVGWLISFFDVCVWFDVRWSKMGGWSVMSVLAFLRPIICFMKDLGTEMSQIWQKREERRLILDDQHVLAPLTNTFSAPDQHVHFRLIAPKRCDFRQFFHAIS